jgi:hypothetical protein
MRRPAASQIRNLSQFECPRLVIRYKQLNKPNTGISEILFFRLNQLARRLAAMNNSMGILSIMTITGLTPGFKLKKPGQKFRLYRIWSVKIKTNKGSRIYLLFMKGTWYRPAGLFPLLFKISTPVQTTTNANKVPMLVRSVTSVRFKNNAGTATTMPVTIVANDGVLNRL